MNLPEGTKLQNGKYAIVRFLSSGGFGCTYEARHVMLGRRVALKEFYVKDFCARNPNTFGVYLTAPAKRDVVTKLGRKFVEEARALSEFDHPNIVHVYDVFQENDTAYYAMDFIDGKTLTELMKINGKFTEDEALRYIREAADALQYVHEHGRLHLDIKPSNIMVDASGKSLLIDFGVSKQFDAEGEVNTSTLMGMTPGYAPLEQMSNDLSMFCPASDVYALGATLYAMLSGTTPPSAAALAAGKQLRPLPPEISDNTRRAVRAAMEIKIEDRPRSINDFLALLDRTTIIPTSHNQEVSATPPTPPTGPTDLTGPTSPTPSDSVTPRRRKSKAPLIVGVVLLSLVCAAVAFFFSFRQQAGFDFTEVIKGPDSVVVYGEKFDIGPQNSLTFTGKLLKDKGRIVLSGYGAATMPNGWRYENIQLANGRLAGTETGRLIFNDGTVFEGKLDKNWAPTKGELRRGGKIWFSGTFEDGLPIEGRLELPFGYAFEGVVKAYSNDGEVVQIKLFDGVIENASATAICRVNEGRLEPLIDEELPTDFDLIKREFCESPSDLI